MEADLQLQLGHIKSQKERVAALAADVERAQEENERLEPRLLAAQKRKEALERDLRRLQQMEQALGFEVDLNILRALDNPMETDILTAAEYQEKMEKLVQVMSELLQRTVNNYTTAHAEQEDQERDFEQRVSDAVQARNMLTEELTKQQKTVESGQLKRVREYELIQQLEKYVAATDSEIWLSRADSHRLSDQLALLTVKPKTLPCKRDQKTEDKNEDEEMGQKGLDRAMAAYDKIIKGTDHLMISGSRSTVVQTVEEEVREERVIEMPSESRETESVTVEELQKLLPQIISAVSKKPAPLIPFPRRCPADNPSTTSTLPPPKVIEKKPLKPCSKIDLKEIIRQSLLMFDVEVEE